MEINKIICNVGTAELFAEINTNNGSRVWHKYDFIDKIWISDISLNEENIIVGSDKMYFEICPKSDYEEDAIIMLCFYYRLFYYMLSDFEDDSVRAFCPTFNGIMRKAAEKADELNLKEIARSYYEECVMHTKFDKDMADALIRLTKETY